MARSVPQLFVRLEIGTGEEFRVVSDSILSFEYSDHERRADKLRLTVDNKDLSNFDDPAWRKGGILIVGWGYEGNMTIARRVVIVKVTGFQTLTIEALAESVLMNTVSKCRAFENVTRSDIVRQIADENGFGSDARHIDDTAQRFEIVNQPGQTDAQFLTRLAAREGFEFYIDFDGFHWHERRLGSRPIRKIRFYTDPGAGDVLDGVSVKNDITRRPGRVRVRGRDPVAGEDIEAVADNKTDSDRNVLSEIIEFIDPDTGASTTVEQAVAQEETRPTSQQSSGAATSEARARFRRAQQVAVEMRVPLVGDPQLYAKTVVELEGFGQRLSQRYWVKEAIHKLGDVGYQTDIVIVSDGHGGHSTTSTRARGLSLVQASAPQRRGGAGGASSREAVEANLAALVTVAESSGDPRAVEIARAAAAAFASRGFEASSTVADATRALAAIGRQSLDRSLVDAASGTQAALVQGQGQESANGGRRNTQSAPENATGEDASDTKPAPLEPYESVDPDSGETVTMYRPRGRGQENVPAEGES